MITFDDAVKIANNYLEDTDLPAVITLQERFSEGWLFCFQSKEYMETGNPSSQLAGNAPFLIDKDTGELHILGTAYPIEKYLEDYEISKNNNHLVR